MRTLSSTLVAALLLPAASLAAPIQITGKVLNPPKEVQVELRPWSVDYAEALRRLKGEAVPPIASAKPRLDGSFELKVPDSGFYSVVVRAPGRLALEHFVRFVVEETETPPVELPAVSPLEVTAAGPDGQPLAGVTIQALPLKGEGDWRAAERSAVTDAEGKAVFPRTEGEALTLVVTTPGRYATATTGTRGASETVRFPAPRSRTVEIRNVNNRPAAGALVRLALRGWPYGLTGEDGRIPLPVPEKNEIGLFAEDARGLRIEIVMTVEAGEGTDVPVVALRPPTLAAGRVLEASSREPIPGALVWGGGSAWTRTDVAGTFELRAPSGERGRIEGTAAGRTRAVHHWDRGDTAPVTLILGPAEAISGHVVDEGGKPIEGAQVATVTNPEDFRTSRDEKKTRSGPDGRFVLRQLPGGRPHTVTAVFEGLAPASQVADSRAPVRLVLRRGTIAAGRVLDGQGNPVEGARLALYASQRGSSEPIPGPLVDFSAVSDAEGRFQLKNVNPGRFDLRVERKGFAPALVQDITIPEGEPRADLGDFALRAGAAVEGIVVDEKGKPVQEAAIILLPGESFSLDDPAFFHRLPFETGPDGRFRLEDLPRGRRVGLEVIHQELVSTEVHGVEVPTAQPLRVRLHRPRILEGRVLDQLGEPVAGAQVSASEGSSGYVPSIGIAREMRGRTHATTDAEGRFTLSGLKPGTVDLLTSASGYRSESSQGIRIPEEGQAEPVEVTLAPGTSLAGVVRDGRGLPVRDVNVHVQTEDPNNFQLLSGTTDEAGYYQVDDLQPGPHQVTATPVRGGAAARAAVEIRPGRNRLDLKIPEGAEVSGRVVDNAGAPLQGVMVVLQRQPSEGGGFDLHHADRFQAVSSADGSFVIHGVTDGDYRLNGQRPGFGAASLPGGVRVAGGPVAGLELRLGASAVIRGRLTGLAPEDSARVMISASSKEAGIYLQGIRDPEGGYRIEDVSPGTWTVMAFLPLRPPVRAEVEMSPGQPEAVLDLEIVPGFTLTGRVLLDQVPLAGAQVMAQSLDPQVPAGGHGRTGYDGTFRLEHLGAGSYKLMVQLPSGRFHEQAVELSGDREVLVEIVKPD